jgi:hypothetical protein
LGVGVLDFQFELEYFGFSFGYISKYWANFCSIFWSLCSQYIGEQHCLGLEVGAICWKMGTKELTFIEGKTFLKKFRKIS